MKGIHAFTYPAEFLAGLLHSLFDGGIVSELNAKKRNKLPQSIFGEPKERKYPMPNKVHAANAKARATQMEEKAKLSVGEK